MWVAIGGVTDAFTKRAGHEITFVDAMPEHVQAINRRGRNIAGCVFTVKASELRDPSTPSFWQLMRCTPNPGGHPTLGANYSAHGELRAAKHELSPTLQS
jgi:hypothetical protein